MINLDVLLSDCGGQRKVNKPLPHMLGARAERFGEIITFSDYFDQYCDLVCDFSF